MVTSAPLSARDRRTLALGFATVSVIVTVGRAVPAWAGWVAAERASAAELEAERATVYAAVRALPVLRDSARSRGAQADTVLAAAVHAPTPAAAGTALAERVGEVATDAGVRLGALAIDVGGTPGAPCSRTAHAVCLHRVRVRTEITGDVRGVASFLAALERGAARVTAPQLTLTQSEPGAPATRAEALRGTVTLEGLAVEEAAPGAGGP